MHKIQKYILSQVLLYTCAAMGLFVFVLVAGKALRDGVELITIAQVNLGLFFKFLGFLLLYVFTYSLPLGFLMGILLVFGRFCAQSEFTAMKAAGYSLWELTKPIFILGIFATLLSLLINGYWAPYARYTYKGQLKDALVQNAPNLMKANTFNTSLPGLILFVESINNGVLSNCWLWELDKSNAVKRFMKADYGDISYDSNEHIVSLSLQSGSSELALTQESMDDPKKMPILARFDTLLLTLPIHSFTKEPISQRYLNELTLPELIKLKNSLPKTTHRAKRLELSTQINKNIAMAFSALCMITLAIPLSLKLGRKETYANLGLALVLALTYFTSTMAITWLQEAGPIPSDCLIWLPNILFFSLGLYLFIKHQ